MSDQTPLSEPEGVTKDQVRTLMELGLIFVGVPVIVLIWIGVLEVRTLRDDVRGNHITASLRAAFKAQPGAFVVLGGAWVGFLMWLASGISGHVFWGIGG